MTNSCSENIHCVKSVKIRSIFLARIWTFFRSVISILVLFAAKALKRNTTLWNGGISLLNKQTVDSFNKCHPRNKRAHTERCLLEVLLILFLVVYIPTLFKPKFPELGIEFHHFLGLALKGLMFPLSANPTKWSNTLKHIFVGLTLKGFRTAF